MGIDFTGFRLDTRRVGRIKRRVTTVRTREQLGSGPTRPLFMAPRASPLAQNGFLPPRSEFRSPPPTQRGLAGTMVVQGKGIEGTRWNEGRNEWTVRGRKGDEQSLLVAFYPEFGRADSPRDARCYVHT